MPPELIENILDFVHDDPESLYAASLVCRAWVSTPRYHMFHRTIIRDIEDPFQENVTSFLSLCSSPHGTILPVIRCAILCIHHAEKLIEVIKVLAHAESLS
ncbi:hypothetical protein BDN70DRAFT_810945 [Pholiota conissans]|uniref:F-box domain-containing protein n=1 Tax=Pholiota conissans TaxID=109636 RepID=A0A9P5YXI6_9AGAR|nr:hypothetical protein BDN70DRAFT_810945 [Pholiota conissans]